MIWTFLLFHILIITMIIWKKGVLRAGWLFIGIFFLNDLINVGPFNSYTLYMTAFVISLCVHGEAKQEWSSFPFKTELLIIFIIHIGIIVTDQRINHDTIKMCSRIFNNYIPRYMALFVGYASLQKLGDWRKTTITLFCIFTLMGVYGVISWLIQDNPYYEMLHTTFFNGKEGIWTDVQNRGYRVLSTLSNPIVYGYVMCIAGHLILLWRKNMNISLWICLLTLTISNIFLANSRTSIVSGLILAIVFLLSKYRLSFRTCRAIALCIAILSVSYLAIPIVRQVLDSTIALFTSSRADTAGSSIDLKFDQLRASVYFFLKHPFWGNGFSFFQETIIMKHTGYERDLAGLEGFGYKLLVEEGIFMIIAVTGLFFNIFRYFLNKGHLGNYANAGTAWTASFLAFMLFTGCWGGIFTIGMLFIGLLIKLIQHYGILYTCACIQCRTIYKNMSGQHPVANCK